MERRQLVRLAFVMTATGVLGLVATAPSWARAIASNTAYVGTPTTTTTCVPGGHDKPCPTPTSTHTKPPTPPPTTPPPTTPPPTTPPPTTTPPATTPATTTSPPATLPVTGAPVGLLATVGAALALGGCVILFMLRRRRFEE